MLFLMLAAATPAFAEIGCLEDQFEHSVAQTQDFSSNEVALSTPSGDEDENSPSGQPMHCAFSHCTHAFPGSPLRSDGSQQLVSGLSYVSQIVLPLAGAPRDGPYYPPRA